MNELKLFLLNHKKRLMAIASVLLIIGSFCCFWFIDYSNNYDGEDDIVFDNINKEVYTENEIVIDEEKTINFISVDIKGRIKKPGVYQIDESLNRRISDVITMAGGLLSDADTSVTNLAKKLFDEMVIIIYSKDEVKEFSKVLEKEEIENNFCQSECDSCINDDELSTDIKDSSDNTDKIETSKLVNINTASKEELMTLSGIGESKALAIIEYRTKTPFEKIEDIMNITGIKESAFNKIKDYITV